jgi:HSP20 family protein
MAIVKWTPMDIMDDMDRFLDATWMPMVPQRIMNPAMDVYEDKDNVIVETPLVGIEPSKVNIEIEDNILKISGQSSHKSEVDDKNYYRKEVRYGSFFRAVSLPKAVIGDKAAANYKDGILKITVPKADEAKPKKITVQAS